MDQYKFRMWDLVMIILCSVSTRVTCLEHHPVWSYAMGTVLSEDQNTVFAQSGTFSIV